MGAFLLKFAFSWWTISELLFLFVFVFLESGSFYIAQGCLHLGICLLQTPKCWSCRYKPSGLTLDSPFLPFTSSSFGMQVWVFAIFSHWVVTGFKSWCECVCCMYLTPFFGFLCIFFKHLLLLYVCEYRCACDTACLYKSENNWNYFNPSLFCRFQEFPSAHQGCAASASTLWGIWEILADDALLCSVFWHCPSCSLCATDCLFVTASFPHEALLDSSFCLSLGFGLNMKTSFLLVPYVWCLPSLIYFHNVTGYSILKPSLCMLLLCVLKSPQ